MGAVIAPFSFALLISLYSGYHSTPVPRELLWQFSPLGLLTGIKSEYRNLESACFFLGKFDPSLDYFIVFLKTCLFEAPFYFLALRPIKIRNFFVILLCANFLTHPLVFFFIPCLAENYLHSLYMAEIFAAGFEAGFILFVLGGSQPAKRKAFSFSMIVLANLFSWQLGVF